MISLKLLAVCRELEGYKAHFKEFAKDQSTKLGAFSAFKNGEKFYCDLLDMNTGQIIEGLEEDLLRAKLEIKRIKELKDLKVKSLIDLFEMTLEEIKLENKEILAIESKRDEAIKTLRKLPVYGYTANGAHLTDYEFPTEEDLKNMPADQPIKAVGFNWKKCDQISSVIGGLQMIYSNGKTSPLFLTKE